MLHELHTQPLKIVGADLFAFQEKQYLIPVDYSSNLGCQQLANCGHIERYGILDTVITNGPQFALEKFQEFALKWKFDRHTSSLTHPWSNGKVKSAEEMIKRLLQKVFLLVQTLW